MRCNITTWANNNYSLVKYAERGIPELLLHRLHGILRVISSLVVCEVVGD